MPREARSGAKPAELSAIAAPELNGILQRLAIFEPPGTIARGYGIREAVVWEILDSHRDIVAGLRRGWKGWIGKAEPLCNKSNAIIFLGNLARRAASNGLTKDALAAYAMMNDLFEKETTAHPDDLQIVELVQTGNFEHAERMISDADRQDEERLAFEPPDANYFKADPKIRSINDAAKKVDPVEVDVPMPDSEPEGP